MERKEIAAVNIFTHVHKLGPRYFMLYIILKSLTCKMLTIHNQRRIQDGRAGRAPSPFEKKGLVFVNFHCI